MARRPYGVLFIQKGVTICPTALTKGGRVYVYKSCTGAPSRDCSGLGHGGASGEGRFGGDGITVPPLWLYCKQRQLKDSYVTFTY